MKQSDYLFLVFATALSALVVFRSTTSLFGYYDADFANYYVQPYGRLWYLLNPYFQSWTLYSVTSALIYSAIIAPQVWLAKLGKLDARIVVLNIFTAIYFRLAQSTQDLTVVAFAPLASINPVFVLPLIIQKVAVGFSWNLSDIWWADWRYQAVHDPIELPYLVILCWLVLPCLVWLFRRLWK